MCSISRSLDLSHWAGLFKQKQLTVDLRRLCRELLDDFMARDRIRNIKTKLRMGKIFSTPWQLSPEERAGYQLIYAWRRHRQMRAIQHDELFKMIRTICRQVKGRYAHLSLVPNSFTKEHQDHPPARRGSDTPAATSLLGAAYESADGWTGRPNVTIEQLALNQVPGAPTPNPATPSHPNPLATTTPLAPPSRPPHSL